jgi:zinc transport system ATP-binding protein
MALLTCRDAAFGYDAGIVIDGLNFTVETGDYLCVVGENGSG